MHEDIRSSFMSRSGAIINVIKIVFNYITINIGFTNYMGFLVSVLSCPDVYNNINWENWLRTNIHYKYLIKLDFNGINGTYLWGRRQKTIVVQKYLMKESGYGYYTFLQRTQMQTAVTLSTKSISYQKRLWSIIGMITGRAFDARTLLCLTCDIGPREFIINGYLARYVISNDTKPKKRFLSRAMILAETAVKMFHGKFNWSDLLIATTTETLSVFPNILDVWTLDDTKTIQASKFVMMCRLIDWNTWVHNKNNQEKMNQP